MEEKGSKELGWRRLSRASCWEESRAAPAEPAEMAPDGNVGRAKGRGVPRSWGGAGGGQGQVGQMKGATTMRDTPGKAAIACPSHVGLGRGAKGGAGLPGAAREGSSHSLPLTGLAQCPAHLCLSFPHQQKMPQAGGPRGGGTSPALARGCRIAALPFLLQSTRRGFAPAHASAAQKPKRLLPDSVSFAKVPEKGEL